MSSDFYFRKWRNTLARLEHVVNLDLDYQAPRVHDKKRCEATLRLSSILNLYMAVYNDIVDCINQNLQVQKTMYMKEVIKSVISRISELKSDIRKLECSNCQFFGNGLVEHHITTYNAEMLELPSTGTRPTHLEAIIKEIFQRNKERKEILAHKENEKQSEENLSQKKVINWWDTGEVSHNIPDASKIIIDEKVSEETLIKRELIILIQSHEKLRQVIRCVQHRNYKRELWAKELSGNGPIPASYKLREKAARLIQQIIRVYFELKRTKIKDCKRDEILGIRQCENPNFDQQTNTVKLSENRSNKFKELEEEYIKLYDKRKIKYLKRYGENIKEEWRDFMRDWFYKWFQEIQFFHDIPTHAQGGSSMIIKEEFPLPNEWLEEYRRSVEENAMNKNKTEMQIKFEKMEAKRLVMMVKKEKFIKKKQEKMLLEKMMKNPNMHPGFDYPESKKTELISKAIKNYRNIWDKLDNLESLDVKEKFVNEIQLSEVCMEVKLETLTSVEDDVGNELKILKTALKNDYIRNEEKMPVNVKKPTKRSKRKPKIKSTFSDNIEDKMEDLIIRDILREYAKIKLEDFVGDPNFAGEDLRCLYITPERHNGDLRYMWWDSCREAIHGFHKILLVGPQGSGRSRLAQILASVNDAILFELDPLKLQCDLLSPVYLQQIVDSVALCAKAVQPSVIHIKNIQKLYYSKVPKNEKDSNLDLIKRYIIKKLIRKIHKSDKITVIGSCEHPWMTKSNQLIKQFPTVFLLPNTTYSIVVQILKKWLLRNPVIPKDLNISSLAYMIRAYTYGYIEQSLQNFLTPERIIRIAAYGLTNEELYGFIVLDEESKTDYQNYVKWYAEKTTWGRKEKQHIEEQKEFQRTLEKYIENTKKKQPISLPGSHLSLNAKN